MFCYACIRRPHSVVQDAHKHFHGLLLGGNDNMHARKARTLTERAMVAATHKPQSLNVAVIGAGAGGLVAARELLREGHHVTVFEKGLAVGGVWQYTDQVEHEDLLGKSPTRTRVHSSMYANLRTNLPREVMAYTDFPFDSLHGQSQDSRRFCSHAEVLKYLQAFAAAFNLKDHIQLGTEVVHATCIPQHAKQTANSASSLSTDTSTPWPQWQVTTKQHKAEGAPLNNKLPHSATSDSSSLSDGSASTNSSSTDGANEHSTSLGLSDGNKHDAPHGDVTLGAQTQQDVFDALVVANGHYSEPRLPEIDGQDAFPGRQMHSHNYRENSSFHGQTVIVIGASASGEDICREIAEVADKVFLCARSWQNPAWATDPTPFGSQHNIWRRPMPASLGTDGAVTFTDGQHVPHADVVLYATGYLYTFPFLQLQDILSVEENMLRPVYQHVWATKVAPTLSFIGLPWKVVPFPQFELVSKWIAQALSGRASLPSEADMNTWVEESQQELKQQGIPIRYYHRMGDAQWAYNDWVAEQCGPDTPRTQDWRRQMYDATGSNKRQFPDQYRDVWRDDHLAELAQKDAAKHTAAMV